MLDVLGLTLWPIKRIWGI